MERKIFVITVLSLITLFAMTHGANAQKNWKKITGPWLWMIAPTDPGKGGAESIDTNSLVDNGNAISDQYIAANGATEGSQIGNYQWTVGYIDVEPPGLADILFGDGNINKTIGQIGMAKGNLDDYTSYALITVNSVTEQEGNIGISSDDAFKIWLNGDMVMEHKENRGANAQEPQNVGKKTLKEGPNLLMVKVSERDGKWAMYVSLDFPDSITLEQTQRIEALPKEVLPFKIETTIAIETATETATGFYFTKEAVPRLSPGQKFILFADIRVSVADIPAEIPELTTVKFLNETLNETERTFTGQELEYTDYLHIPDHEGEDHSITPEKPHAHIIAPETPGSYSYKVRVDYKVRVEGRDENENKIAEVVITVTAPKSDLVVESIKAVSTDKLPTRIDNKLHINSRGFKIGVTVKNQGTEESRPAMLLFYRSANEIISKSDEELETHRIHIPSIQPDAAFFSYSKEIEAVPSAGTQYYGTYVDSSGTDGHTDNNWSDVIELLVHGKVGLEVPYNLISDVAFGSHYTYFVLRAHFPKVMTDEGYSIGNCLIELDLPNAQEDPNPYLASDPPYFAYPLETPEHKINVARAAKGAQTQKLINVSFTAAVAAAFASTAPIIASAPLLHKIKVGFVAAKGSVALGYLIKTTTNNDISSEEEILKETADPVVVLTPFEPPKENPNWWDAIAHSVGKIFFLKADIARYPFDVLFLVKSNKVKKIPITISQEYKLPNSDEREAAYYECIWNLEERWHFENPGAAAPYVRPMPLADYPPFQRLSPEVQEYLLRQFGEFVPARDATDWEIPEVTSLLPNYPNPFNPETWIPYQLSTPADVRLTIYDIQGRVVRDLDLGHQRAGMYHGRSRAAHWDGRNAVGEPVASGVYFYTFTAGEFTATRKMLIRK